MTMLLSSYFLAQRYRSTQYVGAALIMCGSLLAAVPTSGSSSGGSDVAGAVLWYGPLILLAATLPNSLSNVYKERNFKVEGLDVIFLTTAVSLYQVLLGFCFAPLLAVPALGGLPLTAVPHNLWQGWQCFLGHELEGYGCHLPPPPWLVLLLYVLVNFVYNLLLLLITKHGSALLLVIASAVSLPITNVVFTLPLVMGDEAERWSWWNGAGLVVVVVGFLLYSLLADADTGDWLPAQGPSGQMLYIVEEPVSASMHRSSSGGGQLQQRRPRRHSFDVTSSPVLIAGTEERRRAARQRYVDMQRKAAGLDTGEDTGEEGRVFFTPP